MIYFEIRALLAKGMQKTIAKWKTLFCRSTVFSQFFVFPMMFLRLKHWVYGFTFSTDDGQ